MGTLDRSARSAALWQPLDASRGRASNAPLPPARFHLEGPGVRASFCLPAETVLVEVAVTRTESQLQPPENAFADRAGRERLLFVDHPRSNRPVFRRHSLEAE